MVGSSTCLPIGNAAVLQAWRQDSSSVKTKHSGCSGARSVGNELSAPGGVYDNKLDFAPVALKGRLARDMCFSDCYAMNGVSGNWDNCWQFQPCYDNCVKACLNAADVTYGAEVAALDEHLTKYRRDVVSYGSPLLDFEPSALKGRLARDMCFSDCYAKNGKYDYNHCWQFQPCYDNCVQACIDAVSEVTFNAEVASTDQHLTKYRRDVVSYDSQLDSAPSDLNRFARDTCFSDCFAKNGIYDFDHCWQSQPCYDNCITACLDAMPVNFNADVAALDDNLTKYPTEFKCWMRMPTGCDRPLSETSDASSWFIDPRTSNAATCKSRRGDFNRDCSRTDAESQFRGVKPAAGALANGGAANGHYTGARSVDAGSVDGGVVDRLLDLLHL
jgi:hypothetical protein